MDKTGLIEKTNAVLNTRQKFLCVSRPRRFGKSMAADMLAAYYDRGEDSSSLFASLKISGAASYHVHLNQYDVIKVNMQEFLSMTHDMDDMLAMLQKYLVFDLVEHFGDIRFRDENNLIQVMKDIYAKTKRSFVILIDEWWINYPVYQAHLKGAALGARTRDVLIQFLTESAILSALGGIIGVLLAVSLVTAGGAVLGLPVVIKPGIIILAVSFSAVVGIFFGIYPASKAAKADPIDALRYE